MYRNLTWLCGFGLDLFEKTVCLVDYKQKILRFGIVTLKLSKRPKSLSLKLRYESMLYTSKLATFIEIMVS